MTKGVETIQLHPDTSFQSLARGILYIFSSLHPFFIFFVPVFCSCSKLPGRKGRILPDTLVLFYFAHPGKESFQFLHTTPLSLPPSRLVLSLSSLFLPLLVYCFVALQLSLSSARQNSKLFQFYFALSKSHYNSTIFSVFHYSQVYNKIKNIYAKTLNVLKLRF